MPARRCMCSRSVRERGSLCRGALRTPNRRLGHRLIPHSRRPKNPMVAPVIVTGNPHVRIYYCVGSGVVRSSERSEVASTLCSSLLHVPRVPIYPCQCRCTALNNGSPDAVSHQEGEFMDLMGYLSSQRIVYVGDRITDQVANHVVVQLLAMEATNPNERISMYINSGGGIPYAVNAILDTMKMIKCPISTVALGCVMSQSTLILAAGTKGLRCSMPNARIMMHQPQGGAEGTSIEVSIQAAELNRTMRIMQAMYADYTGLPLETVEEETDRDTFMSPQRAKELGLIDVIID